MRGFVHAVWGPRASTIEDSATHLWACLSALGAETDALRTWFNRSKSSQTGQPITSAADLEALLRRGRNRRDDDGTVLPSLGSVVGLWNGRQFDAGVLAAVGSTAGIIPFENSFELDLPLPNDVPALYEIGPAMRIVRLMVDIWNPDRVVFGSQAWREAQWTRDPASGEVGWLTYVSNQSAEIRAVPSVATNAGRIYQLGHSLEDISEESLARLGN